MKQYIAHFLLIVCLLCLFTSTLMQNKESLRPSITITKTIKNTIPQQTKKINFNQGSIFAKAYALIDAKTGRLLFGHNINEKRAMASTTKIMTCILALERGNLSSTVTISKKAASAPKVHLTLRPNETYQLKDLLYSLMLESHNDSAVAIAEHIGGSVEGFAKLMNQKAKELGLTSTHFVTPNGLDSNGHETTAYELFQIARYAIKNPIFLKIINTPSYSFSDLSHKRNFTVNNKDKFLSMFKGAFGIKTGYTGNAGFCFVGAATQDNITLISAVLGSGWPPHQTYKWSDTVSLMTYGFSQYFYYHLDLSKITLSSISINQGEKSTVLCHSTQQAKLLATNNEPYNIICTYPSSINAPVTKGAIIGNVRVNQGNKTVFQGSLTICSNVNRQGWYANIIYIFHRFMQFN